MAIGYMDVLIESLPAVLAMIPTAYEVIGSDKSEDRGYVRLLLESDQIAEDGIRLTMTVHNVGSERVIHVVPCRSTSPQFVDFTGAAG